MAMETAPAWASASVHRASTVSPTAVLAAPHLLVIQPVFVCGRGRGG